MFTNSLVIAFTIMEAAESDAWMEDAQGYSMASSPIQRDDELIPYTWLHQHQLDDVKHYTGFEKEELESIYCQAMNNLRTNKSVFTRSQALFIALWYIRTGENCNQIAKYLKARSNQSVEVAVSKGIIALSKCFIPFAMNAKTTIPAAKDVMLDNESVIISERLDDHKFEKSRFIVDGRHHEFARVPFNVNRTSYYSYKLHCPALSNMFIIDRTGQCNYVSPSYPASTHDITIYRRHQIETNAGLKQMIQTVKPGEELNI